KDGVEAFKEVRCEPKTSKHYTERYLDLFYKAISLLKTITEQERYDHEEDCIIEMRCQQVVDWFKLLNAPKVHSEKFIETLKVFESVPFRYMLVNTKMPTALYYTDGKYVKEELLETAHDIW